MHKLMWTEMISEFNIVEGAQVSINESMVVTVLGYTE